MATACRIGDTSGYPAWSQTSTREVVMGEAATEILDSMTPSSSLLKLPRELRDQIYDYIFSIPDDRPDRALRIERRHIKYFTPTAATILLILHHEDLLLNQQIASEALEVLLKRHTVFLSCGPFVLKTLLTRIEEQSPQGPQWLRMLSKIELDWVTFPNLRYYPPDRENGKDEWWWENDGVEIDVDYIDNASQQKGHFHYDEYDHEGPGYDDNLYAASDTSLYPTFYPRNAPTQLNPADPFGFQTHYPFADASALPVTEDNDDADMSLEDPADEITTKLVLLTEMELTPLFTYLSSPTFALRSITVPLYFISKNAHHQRIRSRPGYALPVRLRYWANVVSHALLMLLELPTSASVSNSSEARQQTLREVRVKYMPYDIWASMDPSDDLPRIVEEGPWFRDEGQDGRWEGEGEAFKAVWRALAEKGVDVGDGGLHADVRFVKWVADLDQWGGRVGDELEIVFTRAG